MKKLYLLSALLLSTTLFNRLSAQFSITASSLCYNSSGPNTGTAQVTVPHATATVYHWSVYISTGTPSCTGTYTSSGSTNTFITISYPCCGSYVVMCNAYNGSTWIATTTQTVTVACPNSLQILSNNNFMACQGTPLTLYTNLYGSGTFTWMNGNSTIGTGTSVAVSPTANTCYTVLSAGCSGSAVACVTVAASPTVAAFIVTLTTLNCVFDPVVLGASGANSYYWNNAFQAGNTATVYPGSTSNCYVVTGTNSAGCTDTAMVCVFPNPGPSLTVSASAYTVCPGQTVALSASGAASYTWNSWLYSSNQQNPVVTVTSNVTFSASGTGTNGCSSYGNNVTIYVTAGNVLNASNYNLCPGDSAQLYVGPPGSYIYSNASGPIGTGNSIVVYPTTSQCYTVTGTTNSGCPVNATACITVTQSPTISISGNNVVCPGGTVALTASGGGFYVWSAGGQTTSAVVVQPSVSTCYTVFGYSNWWTGCPGHAVHCITVASPTLIVSPASATVCRGTSQILSVSGASTYTWNTGATTSTLNVLPQVTTSYTVTGTNSNGCNGTGVVTVMVDTTCSDVWPGDANSDGLVGLTDILEIGLAYNSTGSARTPGGNNFVAQHATNWSGIVSSGKNKCHADCNGDGTVDDDDTLAIFNNFLQTHTFRSSRSAGNDIFLVADQLPYAAGTWNKVDIHAGDATNVLQLYGVTFEVDYNDNVIDNGQAYLKYTPSFINSNNTNVDFRKKASTGGKFYAATVRTDKSDVSGHGKIGELHFKLLPGTEQQFLNITIGNSLKVVSSGTKSSLGGNTISLQISDAETGIRQTQAYSGLSLIPNPAAEKVTLFSRSGHEVSYVITDISGRTMANGAFTGKADITTAHLSAGVYLVTSTSEGMKSTERLIISK